MKKKKQKKTDAAGKYTLPAAGPGWEPSLPDPEQPPRVQRLPYRPDPEQPPRVQRLPYRPDPARPPQVQLLQMQRSALPYVGRAGKNSGAANWVEKLDWKTPSGAPYTSAPEQGGPSNLGELIMAQRGGGGGGFSPGAGAGRGDAPAPGTGVGGGFAGGGGGLWAGDEHAEQSWGDKALRWLDDNLFRPAGYLAEKYAGGAGKQAETLWNGMVTWGRAGAAGELQQDQLAAQQFAFLGGPWETHAQETEKANTAVTQALPQAAQGLRGDAMRDYVEGIDGRYGDPDGLLGWLGERADSAGQGLLSGAARILGVPGAGTAMDFLSTMENAAQQARENGAGEDEAFLYGLGEVVKRIGGQQLEEYFRSKAGELFTRGEVQAMSPREISENYDAIRESMSLWDKDGRLPEDEQGQPDAPTRPDEQMQPNAPELENAGETVYDEIDESLLAPGYENWTDLNRFMQTVLENPELSVEQRVQYIQQAYERTKDKTDILVPRSAADIKEILENGKIEFDWPDELGFNPGYTAIGEGTALPAQMDRYGHAGGNNFCSIPEAGAYTFLQRALPYLENSAAYHAWSFNGDTYLAKIEAVRQQDWNGLNGLLASEGFAPVGEAECEELVEAYENYLRKLREKIGTDFSAPYGVTGTVAAAFGSDGGADQWTMPLSAQQMEDLGILYTK